MRFFFETPLGFGEGSATPPIDDAPSIGGKPVEDQTVSPEIPDGSLGSLHEWSPPRGRCNCWRWRLEFHASPETVRSCRGSGHLRAAPNTNLGRRYWAISKIR